MDSSAKPKPEGLRVRILKQLRPVLRADGFRSKGGPFIRAASPDVVHQLSLSVKSFADINDITELYVQVINEDLSRQIGSIIGRPHFSSMEHDVIGTSAKELLFGEHYGRDRMHEWDRVTPADLKLKWMIEEGWPAVRAFLEQVRTKQEVVDEIYRKRLKMYNWNVLNPLWEPAVRLTLDEPE